MQTGYRVEGDRAAQPGQRDASGRETAQHRAIAVGVGLEEGGQFLPELALRDRVGTAAGLR